MYENLLHYYESNDLSKKGAVRSLLFSLLSKILNRNPNYTRFYFSFLVTKIFQIRPYFMFHYLFSKLAFEDPAFSSVWANTKELSAVPPHKIKNAGMLNPLTIKLKKEIDEKDVPMYKLTWKFPSEEYSEGCVLDYLFEGSSRVSNELLVGRPQV